jgi:glycosyltransferase involved in cell wall biosynthesis
MPPIAAHSASSVSPLVSISMTTYNLEKWLPRALDSVLKQQINFPIEIILGDDCSTDGTIAIARSYQDRHPNLLRVFERTRNVGVQRNTYETLGHCRGKYIAFLDADDYWTDPTKLAVQIDLLEKDPSVSACGHFVRWVSSTGQVAREKYPAIPPGRYGISQILRHNFLPTASVVFRNGVQQRLPDWYFGLDSTSDWPIHVLSALTGEIVLLDQTMADYMLTPNSAFMSKGDLYWYRADAKFYEVIESILPSNCLRPTRAEKGRRYESIAYWLRKQGEFSASRQAATKAFHSPFWSDNMGSKSKSLLAAVVHEMEWKLRNKKTQPAA